jgi:hypothetical protein
LLLIGSQERLGGVGDGVDQVADARRAEHGVNDGPVNAGHVPQRGVNVRVLEVVADVVDGVRLGRGTVAVPERDHRDRRKRQVGGHQISPSSRVK